MTLTYDDHVAEIVVGVKRGSLQRDFAAELTGSCQMNGAEPHSVCVGGCYLSTRPVVKYTYSKVTEKHLTSNMYVSLYKRMLWIEWKKVYHL